MDFNYKLELVAAKNKEKALTVESETLKDQIV